MRTSLDGHYQIARKADERGGGAGAKSDMIGESMGARREEAQFLGGRKTARARHITGEHEVAAGLPLVRVARGDGRPRSDWSSFQVRVAPLDAAGVRE